MSAKWKSSRLNLVCKHLLEVWDRIKQDDVGSRVQLLPTIEKLHHLLISREKSCQDLLSKHHSVIQCLYEILTYSLQEDLHITQHLLSSLIHLASLGKRSVKSLSSNGILTAVCPCIVTIATHLVTDYMLLSENVFVLFLNLLYKISAKDKRCSSVVRLSGALEKVLLVFKTYPNNYKLLTATLPLLKSCCNSSVNCNIILKNDVILVLSKILPTCGSKKVNLLKGCLDLLLVLCKTRNGARRAIEVDGVRTLILLYQEWEAIDQKKRHINLRKSILQNIKVLVNYGFGKKIFLEMNGYKTLYLLAKENLQKGEYENLFQVLVVILRKCARVTRLPLKKQGKLITFELPANHVTSNSQSSVSTDIDDVSADENGFDKLSGDSDSSINKEFDEKPSTPRPPVRPNAVDYGFDNNAPHDENINHIDYFKQFFKELYRLDNELANEHSFSIYIPTENVYPADNTDKEFKNDDVIVSKDSILEFEISDGLDCETTVNNNLACESIANDLTCKEDSDDNLACEAISKGLTCIDSDNIPACEITNEYKDDKVKRNEQQVMSEFFTSSAPNNESCCHDNDEKPTSEDDEKESFLRRFFDTMLSRCNHTLPFVKVAEPFLFECDAPRSKQQPLYMRKTIDTRWLILEDLARDLYPEKCVSRTVYDLDVLLSEPEINSDSLEIRQCPLVKKSPAKKKSITSSGIKSKTAGKVSSIQEEIINLDPLQFESRFECGNLRKAIQVRHYEYDLLLNPDVNCNHHHQWFFFQVTNMRDDTPYRFNIINCEKPSSQFNFGMQPVMFSHKDAISGKAQWKRVGSHIAYYRNVYLRPPTLVRNYYTATFTINFPYKNDSCYLAYHFPYSYSMLNLHLLQWEASLYPYIYYDNQILCKTLNNNDVHLITITGRHSTPGAQLSDKPYIMLTARVHPGESNASWVMKGVIDFLLSTHDIARKLRGLFIFKIIPMLNPDGVIDGCHRCSLSGHDLNRQWLQPDEKLHPSIYHAKALIKYMIHVQKRPMLFVDFHGHSRKKNIFTYGCHDNGEKKSNVIGLNDVSNDNEESYAAQVFPNILEVTSPFFALKNCSFAVEKSKEATARVVVYNEFGIKRSYTMESTYCGFDQGSNKGMQVRQEDLLLMGEHFCHALLRMSFTSDVIKEIFPDG